MNKCKSKKIIIFLMIVIVILFFISIYNNKSVTAALDFVRVYYSSKNEYSMFFTINGGKIKVNSENDYMKLKNNNLIGIANGYIHVVDGSSKMKVNVNGMCYEKDYSDTKIEKYIGDCFKRIEVFEQLDHEQIVVIQKSGNYNIELWGASGGESSYHFKPKNQWKKYTGKGAYVSGDIYLDKGDILYINVGGKGENAQIIEDEKRLTKFGYPSDGGIGGYNGGGTGHSDPEQEAGGGGGGATDVRLVSGKWNNFDSLKSRIMVAAGGGGMSRYNYRENTYFENAGAAGSGGTLKGEDPTSIIINDEMYGYGATQTKGYRFGIGENGVWCTSTLSGLGGGAGGYYGSRSGKCNDIDWIPSNGAGGGSSYVSGCLGCNSILKESTEKNIQHTNKSVHYSGKQFQNIKMISGKSKMPNPKDNGKINGNDGDGYARITYKGW